MFRLSGKGTWGDTYGVRYRSMRVLSYSLTFSRKRNAALLVKPKDAPGVADGDRVLSENEIYY